MKLWPWSEIESLRERIRVLQKKLDACELAADGQFHLGQTPAEAIDSFGHNYYSEALPKILKMRSQLDFMLADQPYKYRNKPPTPRKRK